MRTLLIILIFLTVFAGKSVLQIPAEHSATYLQGFQKRIDGNTIIYNSPQPEVDQALLGRARTEFRSIEWETEPIPSNSSGDFINFIWIFGIDVNVESHPWNLLVNGTKYLTFYNPKDNEAATWSVNGKDGSQITFRRTMIDRYDDAFGYTTLKLPKSATEGYEGKPLTVQILAEETGSNVVVYDFYEPRK